MATKPTLAMAATPAAAAVGTQRDHDGALATMLGRLVRRSISRLNNPR